MARTLTLRKLPYLATSKTFLKHFPKKASKLVGNVRNWDHAIELTPDVKLSTCKLYLLYLTARRLMLYYHKKSARELQ